MTTSLFGNRWRALLLVCISVVGIVLTLRTERSSEARANRLHRSDQLEEALAIYLQRAAEDTAADHLHYNLGTTLLRLGSPAASTELANASVSGDERLRTNAYYNLGLWSLIQALFAPSNDSVMIHATNAIEENKAALRLDPDQPDAVWNLALAQQVFEAASPETVLGNIETPTQGPQLGEVQIVEGPPPPGLDESPGDSPSEAEEEALADEDEEPLSLEEAGEILGTGHLTPSTMLGKLLLRESRSRRRRGFGVTGPPW
jgi:tetratricopeptide (TPR) repeat protein